MKRALQIASIVGWVVIAVLYFPAVIAFTFILPLALLLAAMGLYGEGWQIAGIVFGIAWLATAPLWVRLLPGWASTNR